MSNELYHAINQIIEDKISPSVVFYAEADGNVIGDIALGTATYEVDTAFSVSSNTVYDVASITKIIVATLGLMLVDEGAFALDDTLDKFIPVHYSAQITLLDLLVHTSGIDVQMSALAKLNNPDEIVSAIYNASLATKPGTQVVFTNVNSFLLGKIIETISNASLNEMLTQKLFNPLQMQATFYNPPSYFKPHIPPTEITNERGLIQGEVHDESAYALGGIVGHAGLFSKTQDLVNFCRLWLNEGIFNQHRLLSQNIAYQAIQNHAPAGMLKTGLGWMLNRSWMGDFQTTAFGHTAFTGPSILIVPEYKLITVLLTNRTYPTRSSRDRHIYQRNIMNIICRKLLELDF